MSSNVFPGYPAFLESASRELNLSEAVGPAGRIGPLASLANLCSQAAVSAPTDVPGILAKAAEFRNQLALALRAAELMLADAEAPRDRSKFDERVEDLAAASPVPASERKKAHKASVNSRESS